VHLDRELAGGHQHQRAHRVGRHLRALHGQALQQRQRKAGRLAGAGLGGGHQVAAGQNRRYRLRLHRRGLAVLQRFERAQQGIDQAEGRKAHGGLRKKTPLSTMWP
jgi:hypothetical protein